MKMKLAAAVLAAAVVLADLSSVGMVAQAAETVEAQSEDQEDAGTTADEIELQETHTETGAGNSGKEIDSDTIEDTADQEEIEEVVTEDVFFDIDNDALFAEYVNRLFATGDSDTSEEHGVARRESLDDYQKGMYDDIKEMITEVAAGNTADATVTVKFDETEGKALYEKYEGGTLRDYINEIYLALYRDMPYEFYWYGNSVSRSTSRSTNLDSSSTIISSITFSFAVAIDYNVTGLVYEKDENGEDKVNSNGDKIHVCKADTEKTGAASRAVTNAKDIVEAASGKDLYDALAYFRDQICDLVTYNSDATKMSDEDSGSNKSLVDIHGHNPWAIIYVFDGDTSTNVVCEGYAKAFKYLCDLWDIQSHGADCYLVSGKMAQYDNTPGGHMWNVVQVENLGNYMVDLTACDTGYTNKYRENFFMQAPFSIATKTYNDETRTTGYQYSTLSITYTYDDKELDEYTEGEIGISKKSYEDDLNAQSGSGSGSGSESGDTGSGSGESGSGSGSDTGSGSESGDKGDTGSDSGSGSGSTGGNTGSGSGSTGGNTGSGSGSTGSTDSKYNGWKTENGKDYWYENGVKQGTTGRGKEIYDPGTNAWYWLDAVQGGAKAVSKEVYQESNGGKWVRYDKNGHMIKGWYTNNNSTYYYNLITGAMTKGKTTIDGLPCWFDETTGIGKNLVWEQVNGQDYYWYENGKRQGYDPGDKAYRGKEIYDPAQNAWFWLDNNAMGKKAVSKDVYQPYTYQGKDTIGKWVRYDSTGRMIKGWNKTSKGTYYFDKTTGAMLKGRQTIDGRQYYFNEQTGILQ